MGLLEAAFLGLIQGLTEFLPVSSSGHLVLGQHILGREAAELPLYGIVLHMATALSTVVVFRKDLAQIFKGLLTFKWNDSWKFSAFILVSMIPAGIAGFMLEDVIDDFFSKEGNAAVQLILVGVCLLVTAGLLYTSEHIKTKQGELNFFKAFVIGVAQAVALLPGVSRSGSTISTSLILGVSKAQAARFSFLMVLPVIFGAMGKKFLELDMSEVSGEAGAPLWVGFGVAFITGLLACTWMIRLVKKSKLSWFALYCLVVGLVSLGVGFSEL